MSDQPLSLENILDVDPALFEAELHACAYKDRFYLRRQWRKLKQNTKTSSADQKQEQARRLLKKLQQAQAVIRQRQEWLAAPISLAPDLPVSAKAERIKHLIAEHQVVIVAGETGSGKTTQLPKICLQLGRGVFGQIAHTQPRRLAARTVAERIAHELQAELGQGVGYQVRFQDHSSPASYLRLLTDGILLAEIQQDKYLNRYDTIIIDEAHERSLNIDFLLGYLKGLLQKRPELKLIVTSATIDLERFSSHFDHAPVVEVSGRTFPVDVLYRPLLDADVDGYLPAAISTAIEELIELERQEAELEQGGDILVFLSGEAEIRQVALFLRKQELGFIDILPLYARLSKGEQDRVFDLGKRRGRRVVLATNVAETSLTVPGIRYVIDPGQARISHYSFRSKVQRLPIERISQSSADQRKGRCGRVAQGVCIRLYDEEDFASRPEFTEAEIHRTNLASVILQMLELGLGSIDAFDFVEAPDRRMVNDGYKLLQELNAVTEQKQLTLLGKRLAKLPLDPRIGRMVLAAEKTASINEVLIIASALSIQDPRERPTDKKAAADEKHRRFRDEQSDFISLINLWNYVEQQRQDLSRNQFQKMCKKEFLAYMRVREWREVHQQLRLVCQQLGIKQNDHPASYQAVHEALLTGLLANIGFLSEEKKYQGARNRSFKIFPGSQLKKQPKWLVAADLVETSQLFARTVARIEPEWLHSIAGHLFKYQYSEPHWQARRGQVLAYRKTSLYGLLIEDRKKVHYGPIDSKVSHEIFLRSALVERQWRSKADFYQHNNRLVDEILQLEAKTRRRDLLAEEELMFNFYQQRIPDSICTIKSFENWLKKNPEYEKKLYFDQAFLLQQTGLDFSQAQFPDVINCQGCEFKLSYNFAPGEIDDGVSVLVPLGLLNRVPRHYFEWLVPGLLLEKVIALIKSLPKQWRKNFVPAPDMALRAMTGKAACEQPLIRVLSQQLYALTRISVPDEVWDEGRLEPYYCMNFKVLGEHGQLLGQGRDFEALLEQFRQHRQESLAEASQQQMSSNAAKTWVFGEIELQHQFKQAGQKITAYPALSDKEDSVSIELYDYPELAEAAHRQGLVRLLALNLAQSLKYLRKELLRDNTTQLKMAKLGDRNSLLDELCLAAIESCFLHGLPLPRSEFEFEQRLRQQRSQLVSTAQTYEQHLLVILDAFYRIHKKLKSALNPALLPAYQNVEQQLQRLIFKGFLRHYHESELIQLPRYLDAILYRLDRIGGQLSKDRKYSLEIDSLAEPLWQLLDKRPELWLTHSKLRQYRWLLEEYRVSVFAQTLGAQKPVSAKRLQQQWQDIQTSL